MRYRWVNIQYKCNGIYILYKCRHFTGTCNHILCGQYRRAMLNISIVSLFPLSLVEACTEYRIYNSRRRIDSKQNLSSTDRYDIFNCAFEFGQTYRFTSRPTPHITRQMILQKEKRRGKESKNKKRGGEGEPQIKVKKKCFQLRFILFLRLQTLTNTLTNVDIISFISFCLHSIQSLLSLWNKRVRKERKKKKEREKHEVTREENEVKKK